MSSSGMGGSQDSAQSQDQDSGIGGGGGNGFQMKQEPTESGASPKMSQLTESQSSVKSEGQGSDGNGGREEVPVRAASSPSQMLPGPTSVQSSVTDTDTVNAEQEGAPTAPEPTAETRVVLTGRDGRTPKKVCEIRILFTDEWTDYWID